MLPLFLDVSDRLGVVVGGGPVGRRKADAVLRAGGRVRLVCLESPPADAALDRLEWRTEPYEPRHLDGAGLVFAAATPEVNRRVASDARERGLWVNVADDPRAGDFIVPASFRRGDFTVAVGTGGAAPALAREVRDVLEAQFDHAFGQWAALLADLRPWVLDHVAAPEQRRELFVGWCRWEWLERLRREGPDAVRAALWAEARALVERAERPL